MSFQSKNNRLEKGLDFLAKSGISHSLFQKIEKAARFHGHLCPGLAIGCSASDIALEESEPAEDEEIAAVVENDACGVDAIQAVTGCTFGKGNLVFRDYGKSVYTFYFRKTKKAIRLSLLPDIFDSEAESNKRKNSDKLFRKIRNDEATLEERDEFWKLHLEKTRYVLEKRRELFQISKFREEPPEKARLFQSIVCDVCLEPVMETRIIKRGGKTLCIPCSEKIGG